MAQDTYIDEMTIYNPSGKAIYDAPVTTSAIIKYALMGDYYIELPFSLLTPLDFPLGSYITYKGRKFEIMSEVYPDFDNKTGGYKYTLQFQAQQNHMKNFICFWLGGDNPEAVFHNTTDLASFGALIVANMNKALGGNNWQMGSVNVEHPETNKLVSFNGDTCWDALSSIAETFDVEWWTEENGSIVTLHFGKLNFGTPETFKRGEVVKSIPAKKGDDSEYGTRFYVFGSTRNLTKEYGQSEQGGVTNHVSEVRLRLPDGQQYIDARPGLTKNEIKEVVVFFDDIYPKNTETVTSVETIDRTIIEGQTDKAYVMVCNDTPFLPSDVIEGETLGAHFTSGDLIGWDFELALIDDNGDNIDPATWKPEDGFNKKFEIIAQVETSGESQQIIPNENMRPRGKDDDRGPDTFVLTGVKLPQQRIDEAEQELLEVGTSYAAKHSSDTTVYDCETNPVYCTHNEKNYEAGQAVRLMGPQFGIDGRLSRIQGYEKKLYNEYIATYTIGDNTPYSRLGSIESDVKASLYSQRIGIAENGAAIYLITRYDNTFPTDTNAYSARRAIWEFANKQAPDTFKGRMTFNAGAQFGPSYASGITGVGGFISEKGAGELESLFIRRFLEVPELRYNRVGISVGDDWSAPGAGVIESVDKEQKLVTLKLEEGEIGAVAVGDICMGIFHDFDPSNNATADSDDGRGNFSFAGFATVYFRITEVLGDRNEQFRYELRPLSATFTRQIDPMESMTFVAYGSFTNPARQSSRYSTRTYQRYLRNVSDWEFTAENIAAQFGDLTNLSVFGIQMSGYSAYLDNIYLQGMISSLDKKALLDTRSKLFRLVGDNGVGVAFTPEAGWKQGKLYDPATGQFQKEFDIEQIDQTATEAKDEIANLQFGARNYIAKQFIREWNSVKEGVTDVVTSGADADGTYLYVNWSKLLQAGLAATNIPQGSTVPDCFGGQIKYKPNTPYVFKARIKQGAEMTFRVRYEDGTTEILSAPPAGTEGVYEVVRTIDASRVVQKIYMNIRDGVSMYLYDIQLTEGDKAPTGYITAEEDVQAQIEQVKMDVDYIASDSSLTPSDKQQVANEWVRIQGEYWSIMANAEKYDVPTDSFTVYFQRLKDYLTPLLADMSTTSEITGTEFRKVFSDYYQISNNMSDLIDDAIDESIKSTEYLKKAMEDGSTEVKGGLIMTNVMLLKNAEGDVTAGVSGLQEDDVPFWSGADYTNRKKAVFRVHADGEVHATKGTVGILQVKNDSVEVSDATARGNKIILTTNNINSVSHVLGSSKVPSSQTTGNVAVITSQTKPFASDSRNSSQFKCGAEVQMSAQVKGTIRSGGSVKIEIINQTADTTDTIFRQSSAYDDTVSIRINKNISYRFTTPGNYYIKVTVEASSSGGLGNAASAAVEAITFSFVTDIRKNLIAPNGVAVVKGSSNYAIFTGDIFEVRIGNGGLRIQNGKVYKTNSGTGGWTEI
jgi:hypothetical protein